MTKKYIIRWAVAFFCFVGAIVILQYYLANRTFNISAISATPQTTTKETFTFTTAGDFGANDHTDNVLDKIKEIKPDFQITLGDFSYSQTKTEDLWCQYVHRIIGQEIPFEIISGNHESNGQDGLVDKFADCMPNKISSISGDYGKEYYFDYPEEKPFSRFILISPELTFINKETYSYVQGTKHFSWLNNAIDDARTKGITWVVVGMHKDCIHPGQAPCAMTPQLINFLIQKKVDLVLQAHAHVYMRTKQLSCVLWNDHGIVFDKSCIVSRNLGNIYKKGNGPVMLTVGAAGETIRPISKATESYKYLEKAMQTDTDASFGLIKFDVSKNQIRGEFIPVENGSFKDSFIIRP